jgi:hypothetical protein
MFSADMQQPVLSIVIPTRNRLQYVTHAISSILSIVDNGFELVIHDTSDTRELEAKVFHEFDDIRLRYFYTSPPLTFSQTFSKSVLLSRGEFVCIIGDDDGVNPEIVEAAKWAKAQNIDAITPLTNASYYWPDFRQKYYKSDNAGCLKISKFSGSISFVDVRQEMLNCAKGAFQDFSRLPKVYNGIVKRSCLDKVHQKAGSFFFGASPDISGAMAVAGFVDRLCLLDYPLVIAGSSALSGSGRSAMKKHVGRLDEEPQTRPFCNLWPLNVPAFYSVQTVWAQAAIEGLKEMERLDVLQHYNSTMLQALCLVYNPAFVKTILFNFMATIQTKQGNPFAETYLFLYYVIANYGKRAKSHFYRLARRGYFDYEHESCNLDSVEQAASELVKHLSQKGSKFADGQVL